MLAQSWLNWIKVGSKLVQTQIGNHIIKAAQGQILYTIPRGPFNVFHRITDLSWDMPRYNHNPALNNQQ